MFPLFKPIAWLFSPSKIKLGPPITLRYNGVFKVRISGTGGAQDPIIVSPLDVGPARQLFAQFSAEMEKQLQGRDVPEELNIDWWKGVPLPYFDLVVEEDVVYKTIGLRGIDWQWISRHISVSNGLVLSVVQIRDLKTKQVSTFYFDHTAFFAALAGELGVKLSIACCNSLNTMFSNPQGLSQQPPIASVHQAAPSLGAPPELGTGANAMIAIHANTSADVTNQIRHHLNALRANGWVLGNAHFLIDGWRNEFRMNKGETRSVLVFDLRPTLNRIADRAALECASLAAFKDAVQAANPGELTQPTVNKLKTQGHPTEPRSVLDDLRLTLKDTPAERALGSGKGVRLDEIPNGRGEFGLEPGNPVPVDGVPAIQFYISFLLTPEGQRVQFKRVGSYATPQFPGPTDGYDLFDQSGNQLTRLYVNGYAGGTSEKAPKGFRYFRPFKNEPWVRELASDPEFQKALREAILQPSGPARVQ